MRRRLLTFIFWTSCTAPLLAQRADSAAFIIRLGTDTVAVERYVRSGNTLTAEAVSRSPRSMVHTLSYTFGADGQVTGMTWSQRLPGAPEPLATRTASAAGGVIPIIGPFYTPYELAMKQRVASRGGPERALLLAGTDTVAIAVARVGRDSIALENQFNEPMRAQIDASGRLLHLHTPAFTTVERLPWVDLDALTSSFAARDENGRGLGPLSPRQTYRARVGGANVWVDYSRPGMRGRPVWGGLVPWDRVWRTGANDAAHLAIDRTVLLGDAQLEPGTYTLFLQPGQREWTLIVNRQTGMSGLERDPAQDIARIPLRVDSLPQAQEWFTISVNQEADGSGVLAFAWDRTRASAPLRVK